MNKLIEILLPLKVPWSVVSDTPMFKAVLDESPSKLAITFVARFDLQEDSDNGEDKKISIKTEQPNVEINAFNGRYQIVQITGEVQHFRWNSAFSDSSTVDRSRYDWSLLPCMFKEGDDIEDWKRRKYNWLRSTGQSADPRVYEVKESQWLRAYSYRNVDLCHLLLLGHDMYIEVICSYWTWKSLGNASSW